ncbi:MAG: Gfo/Idh/MocA family oxidoreductase [Euryarchaeota archaeon]|nr:Gfo/Idh/MocA family oxidoreductase [Euryarchaeota archaeon]
MIRAGVIGTGAMGQHHVRILSQLENVELVGIADLNAHVLNSLARRYGTTPYTDYRELLFRNELDVVTVAVPTTLHREVALAAIESGASVLVEKPIADSLEAATEIIRAARRHGVKLMVGHIERFNPAIIALKEIIDRGEIGKVVSMSAKRVGPHNPRIRDVGIILDLGVHDIDVMQYLYGERIRRVFASAGKVLHPHEDYSSMLLKFSNGYSGVIETNWLTPHKVRELTVVGTEGIAYVDYLKATLRIYDDYWIKEAKVEKREPLLNEISHFIECVEGGREPIVSGEDGRHVLEVALAAIRSYRAGRVVDISPYGEELKLAGMIEVTG